MSPDGRLAVVSCACPVTPLHRSRPPHGWVEVQAPGPAGQTRGSPGGGQWVGDGHDVGAGYFPSHDPTYLLIEPSNSGPSGLSSEFLGFSRHRNTSPGVLHFPTFMGTANQEGDLGPRPLPPVHGSPPVPRPSPDPRTSHAPLGQPPGTTMATPRSDTLNRSHGFASRARVQIKRRACGLASLSRTLLEWAAPRRTGGLS